MVLHKKVKIIEGPSLPRSAMAPRASIGVIAANMHWKMQKARAGIAAEPIEGSARTPLRPKYLRSPMYAEPVSENANE